MYRPCIQKSFAFLLSLVLIACGTNSPQQKDRASVTPKNSSSTIAEENQKTSVSIESAQRVVALTSLTADIVEKLAPTKLIGISGSPLLREDDRFKQIPKVSEGQTPPNLEKIVALKPDLVIGTEGFHDRTLDKLEELGIATLTTKVYSWERLLELTKTIAGAIDADPDPLLKRYESFLADIPPESLSTIVLVSIKPIIVPNKDSWAGDLLSKFKAQNLAANLQGQSPLRGYITLSAEKILQENPEVILIVDRAREGILEQFKSQPFWNQLQATQNDRVYILDYYGLVNPGSIDKIEQACTKLRQALASK